MDHVAEHIHELDKRAWEEWAAYFAEFGDSDVFMRFMSEHPTWYSPRLRDVFSPSQREPPREETTRWLPDEAVITRWWRKRRLERGAG
jgi:hypothetical protein